MSILLRKYIGFFYLLISLFTTNISFSQGLNPPIVNSVTIPCNDSVFTLNATPGSGGNSVYWYSDYLCATLLDSGLVYNGKTQVSTMLYAKSYDTVLKAKSADPTQVFIFKPELPVARIILDTTNCNMNLIVVVDTAIDSINFIAMEDATIDKVSPNTNFNNSFLNIRPTLYHTNYSNFILKFDLNVIPPSVNPYSSCLQAMAYSGFAHGNNGNVYTQLIPNDLWSEDTVTFNNARFPTTPNSIPNSNGWWWVWYGFPSYSSGHGSSATMGGSPEGNKLRSNCNISFNQILRTEYQNDKTLSTYHYSIGYDSRYFSKDHKTNVGLLPQIFTNFSYNKDTSCTYSWTGPNGFSSTSQNLYNLTDTGTYTVIVSSPYSNCNVTLSKQVSTIIKRDTLYAMDTICFYDSVYIGGQFVSTSGVYYDTLSASSGCDTLLETTLHVLPTWQDTTFLYDTICSYDSIYLGGKYVSTSGTYYDTVGVYYDCDSLVQTELYVKPAPNTTVLNDTICFYDKKQILILLKKELSVFSFERKIIAFGFLF